MADFNLSEILVKSRDEAVSATGKEAAAAAERAIKRIANPVKNPFPKVKVAPAKAPAAPPWFKYGLYGLAAFLVYKVVAD